MSVLFKPLILFSFSLLISSVSAKSFDRRARVIHIDVQENWDKSWYNSREGKEKSLEKVLQTLATSKTGRLIIARSTEKAKSVGASLRDVIDVGSSSLTDTTLIRKFSPDNPSEIHYQTKSKVYLNKGLSFQDAVLDLAHELTHYSYREPFNPYVTKFTVDQFVSSVIEGRGGEVDAYLIECRVLKELRPSNFKTSSNCKNVVDPQTGNFSKSLGVARFYDVGEYSENFEEIINKYGWEKSKFPKLGKGEALYISSAYGLPYPVAALSEFTTIMGKACENDYNRLVMMREGMGTSSRSPASFSFGKFKNLYASYKTRCSQFRP
ncbi:hypothetical protein [Halobacteriovorax marinus]|uniref:hypothetical protein n=1 Tax=Halobacteriovorax marinus TaxID=97084 RepID=UPI0012FDB8C5|nr:hypothetical protein [Halobacteriovorax marinus]